MSTEVNDGVIEFAKAAAVVGFGVFMARYVGRQLERAQGVKGLRVLTAEEFQAILDAEEKREGER